MHEKQAAVHNLCSKVKLWIPWHILPIDISHRYTKVSVNSVRCTKTTTDSLLLHVASFFNKTWSIGLLEYHLSYSRKCHAGVPWILIVILFIIIFFYYCFSYCRDKKMCKMLFQKSSIHTSKNFSFELCLPQMICLSSLKTI